MAAVQQGEPNTAVKGALSGELSSDTKGELGSPASDTRGELISDTRGEFRGEPRLGGGIRVELSPPYMQGEMLGNQDPLGREFSDRVGLVAGAEAGGLGEDMDLHTHISPELSPEDQMLGIDNVGLDFAELDLIMSGEGICLPDSPPDSSSDGCLTSPQYTGYESADLTSPQYRGYEGAGYPTEVMGYQDPPLYSHSQFAVRHPSLHDRGTDLHTVDYSQPHQLVEEAQQCRVRVQTGSLPTRLTVRGVTNNNLVTSRQTALSPRDTSNQVPLSVQESLGGIKTEPLPSPPVAPLPCPGPPVKKRRREDQLRGGEEVTATTVKTEGEGSGGETQQMVRFVTFQPGKWSQTFSQSRAKLPTPVLKVSADKGFNFSNLDDAFIAQKKNHFQLTCHVVKEGLHDLVSTEAGFRPIEHLQLNFYGVKSEAPEQRIQIEQSQTDRSRKRFFPIKLAFRGDQPMRVSIGRLHFSETTLNNMRKKGRPNPEQRYFQLVVGLEAVVLGPSGAKVEVPLFCLATERIIVRASNPGLFEPEQEVSWTKQGPNSDTVYHMGKVGIGTEHSSEALTVQGNIQVSGEVLHPSDRRIKTSINPVAGSKQLQNIQNVQVVEYQYKPEYLARFPTGEREQMMKRQTGVIAQDLRRILPDAVETAGNVTLPGKGQVDDMLIVNKDRLFLENVGAVRELSKVTDSLGHRIEELESHTVKMTRLRGGSVKSSASLSTSSSCPRVKHRDGSVFRSRWVQGTILALVAIMTLCLVAMATLYILQFVQREDPDFPLLPIDNSTSRAPLSSTTPRHAIIQTTRGPSMRTTPRYLPTHRTRQTTTPPPQPRSSTARTKTFPAIGKPHNCNAPDAERACDTYCCIPPLPLLPERPSPSPSPDYSSVGVTGPQLSLDDNTISSPGPQADGQEGGGGEESNLVEGGGEEGQVAVRREVRGREEEERSRGEEGRGEGQDTVNTLANADTELYHGVGGEPRMFVMDPKESPGSLASDLRDLPPVVAGQRGRPRALGLEEQEPRVGREENSDRAAKKEEARQHNQILSGDSEKEDKEGRNSTSQEEGSDSPGRKSSKSLAPGNSVGSGAEKNSARGSIVEKIVKGLRRRRSAEVQEGKGCTSAPHSLYVDTGVGRVDLSREYCHSCTEGQGHNCSYLLPLSSHLPDPSISLLLPSSALACPASHPHASNFCPSVNEIAGSEEEASQDLPALPPPSSLPPGLMAVTVDVRLHSSLLLSYRVPSTSPQPNLCSLPDSDLGKAFTQINVRVARVCGE